MHNKDIPLPIGCSVAKAKLSACPTGPLYGLIEVYAERAKMTLDEAYTSLGLDAYLIPLRMQTKRPSE